MISQEGYAQPVIELSVVIPVNNEEKNVSFLYEALIRVLDKTFSKYEIIFVDDGSVDNTAGIIKAICKNDKRLRLIRLSRNFGQSVALSAGFDFVRGAVIVSLDGDLQHDPRDIPRLVAKINEGYDIVNGWRKDRVDGFIMRRIPSLIANKMMGIIFGIKIKDFGSTLKAYRPEVVEDLDLFGELHRFIPALVSSRYARIAEIPITNTLRKFGKSHYGISRTWGVILDLCIAKFLTKFIHRPFRLFGAAGIIIFSMGFLIGSIITVGYYFFNLRIQDNLGNLIFAALMMILGFQLIAIGLLSEIIGRIYYASQKKKNYIVKEIIPGE